MQDESTLYAPSAPAVPDIREINRLWASMQTPEPVIAHCRAVAELAEKLRLSSGCAADPAVLQAACLLHDLCRTSGRSHPAEAAARLIDAGFPLIADAIAQHHDLGSKPTAEAELLYLADKMISGTTLISIHERFDRSATRCASPEAQEIHARRRADAERLYQKYGEAHS